MNIIRTKPFYKGVTRKLTSPTQTSNRLTYTEGTVVIADGIDLDPDNDCGQGANLYRANLSRANLYGANLSETRCDSDTTLPDGYKLTNAGLVVKK